MTRRGARWAVSIVGPAVGAAGLVGAMAGLHLLGSGALAAPAIGSVAQLRAWSEERDAVTIGMVVLRLLALGVGYHLALTTGAAIVGRIIRRPGLVRAAEAATLPPLRSALRRTLGLALSASAVLTTPLPPAGGSPVDGGAPVTPRPTAAVLERIDPAAPTVLERIPATAPSALGTPLETPPPPGPTATLRLVADGTGPTESTDGTDGKHPAGQATMRQVAAQPDPQPEPAPAPAPARHVVRAGDHLWAIAEATLARHLGRPATDEEVDPYWRAVVAANPQLTDPDLLFAGELVTVPPLPAGAARISGRRG